MKEEEFEECEEPYDQDEYEDEEDEGAFEQPKSFQSVSQRNTKPEPKAGTGITIDISSVEKLIHNLDFSAMAIEQALLKVSQNKDISVILNELSKIRSMDINKSNAKVEEAITKFNISNIERKIDQKFDAK